MSKTTLYLLGLIDILVAISFLFFREYFYIFAMMEIIKGGVFLFYDPRQILNWLDLILSTSLILSWNPFITKIAIVYFLVKGIISFL